MQNIIQKYFCIGSRGDSFDRYGMLVWRTQGFVLFSREPKTLSWVLRKFHHLSKSLISLLCKYILSLGVVLLLARIRKWCWNSVFLMKFLLEFLTLNWVFRVYLKVFEPRLIKGLEGFNVISLELIDLCNRREAIRSLKQHKNQIIKLSTVFQSFLLNLLEESCLFVSMRNRLSAWSYYLIFLKVSALWNIS